MGEVFSIVPFTWVKIPGTGLEVYSYADKNTVIGVHDQEIHVGWVPLPAGDLIIRKARS